MADEIKIGYFLEDVAHRAFITAFVKRLLKHKYGDDLQVEGDIFCESGGSKEINSFRAFLKEWKKDSDISLPYHSLVIGHDCNCKGKETIKKKFSKPASKAGYPEDRIIYALPDPYIERWYLADPRAFLETIEGNEPPGEIPYVHKKGKQTFYKDKMQETLWKNGIGSSLAGAELGDRIAELVDIIHNDLNKCACLISVRATSVAIKIARTYAYVEICAIICDVVYSKAGYVDPNFKDFAEAIKRL